MRGGFTTGICDDASLLLACGSSPEMRWFVLVCSVVLSAVWLLPESVVADNASENKNEVAGSLPPEDTQAHAQSLEDSLRAVEWYTNESVRKALHAEAAGDNANARLFGDKAIESDKKAKNLRLETANAWLVVNDSENAQAVWFRAAGMAEERAVMLGKRIPLMTEQWQSARNAPAAQSGSGLEQEILYLQALFFTAQQWAVAADFFTRAGEQSKADAAKAELQALLPRLQANDHLKVSDDPRLKEMRLQVQGWQAGRLP